MILRNRKINKSGGAGLEYTDFSVKYSVDDFFDSEKSRMLGLTESLTKEREIAEGIKRQITLDFGTREIILLFNYRQTKQNDALVQKDFDDTLVHFENILG